MIEVFLYGIELGLIPITMAGLFVTAYLQYRRGDQLPLFISCRFFFLKIDILLFTFFIIAGTLLIILNMHMRCPKS